MRYAALTSLALVLGGAAPLHPQSTATAIPRLIIPGEVYEELTAAGRRTLKSEEEEGYCLTGKVADGKAVVTGWIKPDQNAFHLEQPGAYFLQGYGERLVYVWALEETWLLDAAPCPPGTIAGAHTHPLEARAPFPSEIDEKGGAGVPYRFHLVIYPTQHQAQLVIAVSAWVWTPSGMLLYRLEPWKP